MNINSEISKIIPLLRKYDMSNLGRVRNKESQKLRKQPDNQEIAYDKMHNGENLFITGPAGCGKSFIVNKFYNHYIKHNDCKYIHKTSTTGISAILIKGITIHSFSGLETGKESAIYYLDKIRKKKHKVLKNILDTKVLIIDEISMMSIEFFEKLEYIIRKIKGNGKIFGGIQLIVTGDFCQLPPINSDFCFNSQLFKKLFENNRIYLNKNYRQNDPYFSNILMKIRMENINDNIIQTLSKCVNKKFPKNIKSTKLFAIKKNSDFVNNYYLNKLIEKKLKTNNYKLKIYNKNIKEFVNSQYHESFTKKFASNLPVKSEITLTINTLVIICCNMPEYDVVNGTTGKVVDFDNLNNPILKLNNNTHLTIQRFEWETKDIYNNTYTFSQYPLILGWAITIHKSQGMSLDYVKINLDKSIFEYGQAYVALSRVKSLNGLSLYKFNKNSIKTHPKVIKYYESFES